MDKGTRVAFRPSGCLTVSPGVSTLALLCVALQFEMLTGSLPFQGKDRKETMALVLK